MAYVGRAHFVETVMNLLGLEVGDHTRARLSMSDVVVDRTQNVKRRRRAPSEASRLKRRAAKAGLHVQPVDGGDVDVAPGVRRCGICRMPGHKVQTCPAAKQQLLALGDYGSPSTPQGLGNGDGTGTGTGLGGEGGMTGGELPGMSGLAGIQGTGTGSGGMDVSGLQSVHQLPVLPTADSLTTESDGGLPPHMMGAAGIKGAKRARKEARV